MRRAGNDGKMGMRGTRSGERGVRGKLGSRGTGNVDERGVMNENRERGVRSRDRGSLGTMRKSGMSSGERVNAESGNCGVMSERIAENGCVGNSAE